jgi:alkylation response protein AidB-like acyl-CoA dehydrogenase
VFESDKTYDQELWDKIVQLGWTGVRVPEEYQGLGLSHLELCVIAEELGRRLAPVPFSSSVYLFTETLIEFGSEEQKKSILPKLVTGDVIGTLAIAETNSAPNKDNIAVVLKDGKLSGTKIAVPDAEVATHAVVVAKNGDSVSLCVAELNSDNVEITVQRNIDESRGYYSVSFNEVNAEIIGDEESGWSNLEKIMDHAAVLFSFEQIGGAQASLDMANTYAKERYAFGRPIGSFQSMKHKLADMYVALTLAKSNSFYGAWALSSNASELPTAAATARVSATKAFQLCSQENIQTHGGNGFTWEYDCHMFYKRSKVLSLNLGSLPSWREKLITSLEQANVKL